MLCYVVLFVCSCISGLGVFYLLLKGLLVVLFLLCYPVFSCFLCKFLRAFTFFLDGVKVIFYYYILIFSQAYPFFELLLHLNLLLSFPFSCNRPECSLLVLLCT
jgi:hypothetical protein